MKILVLLKIKIVKRVLGTWITIAESKVNGDAELDLTSSEDVLKECVSFVEDKIVEAGALVATTSHQLELKLAFP